MGVVTHNYRSRLNVFSSLKVCPLLSQSTSILIFEHLMSTTSAQYQAHYLRVWKKKIRPYAGLWLLSLVSIYFLGHYRDYRGYINLAALLVLATVTFSLPYHLADKPRIYTSSRNSRVAAYMLPCIAISALALYGIFSYWDYDLRKNGIPGCGIITAKYRAIGRSSSYILEYSFGTDRVPYYAKESLDPEEWNLYNKGDSINVLYLPTLPENNKLFLP